MGLWGTPDFRRFYLAAQTGFFGPLEVQTGVDKPVLGVEDGDEELGHLDRLFLLGLEIASATVPTLGRVAFLGLEAPFGWASKRKPRGIPQLLRGP